MDLKTLEKKKLSLEKKVASLNQLEEEKLKAQYQMNEALDFFKKESNDVDQMEKSSLKSFMAMVTGRFDETFEKERREMVEAKLKYDHAKDSFNRAEEKYNHCLALKKELETIKKSYDEAVNQIKERMLEKNPDFKRQYEKKKKIYDQISKELIEVDEAYNAGEIVLQELSEAQRAFDSAANWGIFDMVGGGLLATMAKHNKINEGKRILNKVSRSLSDFNRELKDVDQTKFIDMNINISDFLTFADYFFDGIFADFTVQSKINNVKSKISSGFSEIHRINSKLLEEKQRINDKKKALEQELDALVTKYV